MKFAIQLLHKTPGVSSEVTDINVFWIGPNVTYIVDVLNNARGILQHFGPLYVTNIEQVVLQIVEVPGDYISIALCTIDTWLHNNFC